MEADVRWCPTCKLKGETKYLRLYQINDDLAALLCDNEQCVNLGEIPSVSSCILQRKSSDIPTTKKKKRRPNTIPSSTPKMQKNISHPVSSSSTQVSDTVDNQRVPSLSSGLPHAPSKESDRLLKTPSLKATPEVRLWRNKSALCWLDACMCVLLSCRSLRACLIGLPENLLIRTLCKTFESAQSRPCLPPRVNPSKSCSEEVSESNAQTLSGSPDTIKLNQNPNLIPSVDPNTKLSEQLCNVQHVRQEPLQSDLEAEKHCLSDRGARHVSERKALDPLDDIRDKLFKRLQPKLKCQLGQDESPVVALPLLLKLDASVEEHFLCRYRWEFYCNVCGYADVVLNKKTMPTLTSVPADFNMADPTMLQNCPQCRSQNQKSHLVFHSFPMCVMLHFQDGLSDDDYLKHISFIQGGDTYELSAIIQYRHHPNHFVTVLRDPESNYWLEYDDILPSPFTWQPQAPLIPAKEIHILIWERVDRLCTACIRMHSDVTALRESLAKTTLLSSIPEGKMNTIPHRSRYSLWNSTSISKEHELGSQSTPHSEGEPHCDSRGSAQCCKGEPLGDGLIGIAEGINSAKVPKPVIDLTLETVADTADCSLANDKRSTPFNNKLPTTQNLEASAGSVTGLPEGPLSALSRLRTFRPSFAKKESAGNKQSEPVIAENINTTAKQKAQRRPQTFLDKQTSRSKRKSDRTDVSTQNNLKTMSILGKIPDQFFKFAGTRTLTKSAKVNVRTAEDEAPKSGASSKVEDVSRNESILGMLPKQLLPVTVNHKQLPPRSQPSRTIARTKKSDSLCKESMNQRKFQPYSYRLSRQEPLKEESKEVTIPNIRTLNTWQKRVGMFSAPVPTTSKRVRRDSTDENCYSDQSKQAWCPTSSVSSPSACSDISSLSDNQSLASGRDDLANTIGELYKVLGSDYSCTPSVSSRLSSPSQDMFFSDLLNDDVTAFGLEDLLEDDRLSVYNRIGQHMVGSEHQTALPTECRIPNTRTAGSSMPAHNAFLPQHSQPSSLTLHNSPQMDTTASSNSQITVVMPNVPSIELSEGTLPSIAQTCSAYAPVEPAQPLLNPSTSPSCVPELPVVNTVAMQPGLSRPHDNTGDSVIHGHPPSCFNQLSDCTTGVTNSSLLRAPDEAGIEGLLDIDDIMDPDLFDVNLDFTETDWSSNFVELLAQ